MTVVLQDLRHAIRLYRRTPRSSVIVVLVLAVAMAFFGAFLSLYVDLVLRPHPAFEQSGRIATIGQNVGGDLVGMPYALVEQMSGEMTSIDAAAAVSATGALAGRERNEIATGMVSEGFFDGLRPRLALGRGLTEADNAPDAEPVAVLSYAYWQRQFGADRNVLGRFLELGRNPSTLYYGGQASFIAPAGPAEDSAEFRIVGVMADAASEVWPTEPAVWVPIERAWPILAGTRESLMSYLARAYVRRAPGASATAVANELQVRYGNPEAFPSRIPGARLDAIDGIVRSITVQREAKRQLELFLAGSILLALVAAANVSLFLLARAPGRRRELGIRLTVGARVKRLARQLATESALLVIVATVLGFIGSVWLSLYLRSLSLLRQAEWRDVSLLDWRVLGLAGVFLLLLTVIVSLAPILGLRRIGIAAMSHVTTTRASLAQRLAGTAQIAVAGTLGGAAIAFVWYFGVLMFGDAGYETGDLYMVDGVADIVGLNRNEIVVEYTRRREAIEAIPGVSAVAYGSPVPGGESEDLIPFPVRLADPNDPTRVIEAYTGSVDDRYVDLMGFRVLYGRAPGLAEADGVVVNQALAQALWGRDDVVGERIPGDVRWGMQGADVLGVLEDLSFDHPSAAAPPYAFSVLSSPVARRSTVIRAELTAADLQQALDELTAAGTLEAEVTEVVSLGGLRAELIAPDRARGLLTIAAAGLVVLLAAFGFYGTQRYLVAVGRREYAIRASLGAGPAALGRLVLRRGLVMGLPGLVLGGSLAFIVVAYLRDNFVAREISPGIVTACALSGLAVLLMAASVGPAREARRTRVAPLLRED